jgi:hypothetical protein
MIQKNLESVIRANFGNELDPFKIERDALQCYIISRFRAEFEGCLTQGMHSSLARGTAINNVNALLYRMGETTQIKASSENEIEIIVNSDCNNLLQISNLYSNFGQNSPLSLN